ncbi:hypothetical protein F511_28856 [Dorcoceras hygrometricum]|uniref:Uncharacterized protein n=1 Tax=Dorcoceras hygrometricum TaxID=472368 RepID=A0A2Z7B359_9LAMI|nr:hypothetical protein F511_28856 [Dorcoceras hygrometricum]
MNADAMYENTGQQPKATTKEGSQRTQCTAERKSVTEYVATGCYQKLTAGSHAQPATIQPIQLNRKLKQRLILRSQQQFEVLPQRHDTWPKTVTSRSSTSRSQIPKVVWNDRVSQEESNATSNVSNNGRQRREFTG